MNRRGFLKMLSAGIVALTVPVKLLAVEIKKKFKPHKIKCVGKERRWGKDRHEKASRAAVAKHGKNWSWGHHEDGLAFTESDYKHYLKNEDRS